MTSILNPPTNPQSASESFKQKHEIMLTGPSTLLSCTMDLTISSDQADPGNPTVDSLHIRNLSPWAKREVGSWMEERAEEGDISVIGFALGRYWDVSVTRAQCWMRCCRELGHLVTCATDAQRSEKEKEQKKRGKKTQRQIDDDEEMLDTNEVQTPAKSLSKRELHTHLGRQELILENDNVILRISWHIQFDLTGEVESVISAKAAFPKACRSSLFPPLFTRVSANLMTTIQGKKQMIVLLLRK
jgi:hypothetical protein